MSKTTITINAEKSNRLINFEELWEFRELFYIFTWRNVKVRYRQTVLGIIWVILQPLLASGIFTIFFGKLAEIPSGELPYGLFVYIGMVFWSFFSNSLIQASGSLVADQNLIKKIYFPKIILPLSEIFTNFIDFTINFSFLLIIAFILGYYPDISILLILPLAIVMTCITSVGLSLFFSSLNVKYRDVRFVLPYFFQILLFLTPIIYPLDIVGERNQKIMAINPMTMVVDMMRGVFTENYSINYELLMISLISMFCFLIFGLWYFKKTERYFADIV